MPTISGVFDTKVDTRKIFVTIKIKFVLRNYINKQGYSPIYLFISSTGARERVKTDIEVLPQFWCPTNQRVLQGHPNFETFNIIIENIISKVTKIKTVYLLSEKQLSAKKLVEELRDTTPRADFIVYFKHRLKFEKPSMSASYYKRINSVYHKLKDFQDEILFSDITPILFDKYRRYCLLKKNEKTTIAGNLAAIKKFLHLAHRDGIKFPMDLAELKVGRSSGNRIDLSPKDLQKMYNYYFSEFIPEEWKLVLGYFLFSAFTSIRWTQVIERSRKEVINTNYINFFVNKTNKRQSISLNQRAKDIVAHTPNLFNDKLTNQYVNRELKKITKALNISKQVTFHVARHTFATNFLRMGGNVVKLKLIMGHSKIETTMIYVHIVEQEANKDMALMDMLF